MAESHFDEWVAARYEILWPELFDPAVVEPAVEFLAGLARSGPALELGVGTGRIALPLRRRGVQVDGIELSPAMAARLRSQADATDMNLIVGDFATASAAGPYELVYLDLMARLAGMTLTERWADWHRTPFTGESRSHISVWTTPPRP